ncbi:MAG: hypothetical protein LUE29_10935 [Lachnospiraceae bacterium]|nr:hypothetical protein [Lachnospiraceae bacterium]
MNLPRKDIPKNENEPHFTEFSIFVINLFTFFLYIKKRVFHLIPRVAEKCLTFSSGASAVSWLLSPTSILRSEKKLFAKKRERFSQCGWLRMKGDIPENAAVTAPCFFAQKEKHPFLCAVRNGLFFLCKPVKEEL